MVGRPKWLEQDDAWKQRSGRRFELLALLTKELERAYAKHGDAPWGRHEFYAILLEEVDELWESIKADEPQARIEEELVQVAAMCFRYFETLNHET